MKLYKKRKLRKIAKDNSLCVVEDVVTYHQKLIELDVDENFQENLISILEGYELVLKGALRNIKDWKTNNLEVEPKEPNHIMGGVDFSESINQLNNL